MKKIAFILALLMPLILSAQEPDIINLDELGSTWQSIELDTLYFSKDSTYITGDGDTIQFVVDSDTVAIMKNTNTDPQLIIDPNLHSTETRPGLAFGDGNTGFYEKSDNSFYLTVSGVDRWLLGGNIQGYISGSPAIQNQNATSTTPTLCPDKFDLDSGIGSADKDSLSLIAGGVEGIRIAEGGGKILTTFTDEIAQTTTTTANSYHNHILSEWVAGAAMAAGGSNGIYSWSNPIEDVQNAYSLRGRMDLRDAGAAVDVGQLHAVDALINFNETHAYDVVDNISVIGAAVHGNGADITGDGVLEEESLNLFYGVWGPTATQNFEIITNGMLLMSHAGTYLDYGVAIENSGAMTAGLYLNNHPSNSPATMTSGILMESAAGNMTYGINMTGAGISTADILFQNGATANNLRTGNLTITEDTVTIDGVLVVTEDIVHSGGLTYVSTEGTQTIGTGGTFERLNEGAIAYTSDHLGDFTHSDGRLTYTGTPNRHFVVAVNASIESDEANALIQIRLAKGGSTIVGTNMQHDYTAVDTDASMGFTWLLELATNEYLEVYGTSDQNGDTFVVHNLVMTIGQH